MKKCKSTVAMLFMTLSVLLLCTGCGATSDVLFSGDGDLETENAQEAQAEETQVGQSGEAQAAETSADVAETGVQQTVFVHVCGAVAVPGVYELEPDARIYEAVAKAGGCTQEACADALNLAQKVSDGMRVYVPTAQEAADESLTWITDEAGTQETGTDASESALVNLNTATKEELMTLPGIGEAKAACIVAYREQNGAFSSIEEIMQVSGIKESTFEKIKDQIKV